LPRAKGTHTVGEYLAQAEKQAEPANSSASFAFSRKSQVGMQVVEVVPWFAKWRRSSQTIDKRIEVIADLPGLHPVKADIGQVHQVLNLFVNARDAVQSKLETVEKAAAQISLTATNVELDQGFYGTQSQGRAGSFVRISVSDTGAGMSEECQARLFEPFYTTTALGKGTGLGLATAYGLVKQHGGWIDFSSRLGEGAFSFICLPRYAQSHAATSAKIRYPKVTRRSSWSTTSK
jgi:hypothetical protein